MASKKKGLSRRDMLKTAAAASAFAGASVPLVHAGESNTIKIALIGCGGRGTGAAADALRATGGPVQLVAMADVFSERLNFSYNNLNREFSRQMDVPNDRKFVGFDAYRRAMDCLRAGDIAIMA